MLEEIYERCREKLSKSDHRIFGYLMEHEHEIQMMTAEDMAKGLNLSTATISRFWTKIGYRNLKELKLVLYKNTGTTPFSRMDAALTRWRENGISPEMLMDRISSNLNRTFQVLDPENLDKAAEALLNSNNVYIFAPDASYGLGRIFAYRMLRLGICVTELPGGSQIFDSMINIHKGDVVLLFAYSRILKEVEALLSHAHEAGYSTILFTDIAADNILSDADIIIYSCRGELNDYHSMAVPMMMTDIIIMKASQRSDKVLKKARELEKLRGQYMNILPR